MSYISDKTIDISDRCVVYSASVTKTMPILVWCAVHYIDFNVLVTGWNCLACAFSASDPRLYPNDMLMHFTDIGRAPPQYGDAAVVANSIMSAGIEFDVGELHYNIFR